MADTGGMESPMSAASPQRRGNKPQVQTTMEMRSAAGFDESPFGTGLVLGSSSVLYSIGRNIVRLNTETKGFSLLSCHELCVRCLGMCLSLNQKYIAVAERHSHEQYINISVYNLVSGLMSRNMAIPDTHAESGEVLGMAFSNGGKVLLVQMGSPDYVLIAFKWVSGKLLKSIRGERDVFKVTFNEHEMPALSATTALTASPQSLRFWKCDEDSLRHVNSIIPKTSSYVSFTQVEWLSAHVLAAANDRGEVIIYDDCEMTSIVKIPDAPASAADDDDSDAGGSASADAIIVIKSLSIGFLVATRAGRLFVYALNGSKDDRTPKLESGVGGSAAKPGDRIKLNYEAASPYVLQQTFHFCGKGAQLVALSVFPDENTAVAFTDMRTDVSGVHNSSKDILLLSLRQQDDEASANEMISRFHRLDAAKDGGGGTLASKDTREGATAACSAPVSDAKGISLLGGYPKGAILGIALCEASAIVATIAEDKTLRIWNYAEQVCLLSKRFIEDLLSVSIHPDGFRLLLGTNRLRMYSITVDDLHLMQEFSTTNCRLCAFSKGGASFAAASSAVINVYNTYTYEHIATLRGHQSTIIDLCWSLADLKILSAGTNGTVYQFPMVESGGATGDTGGEMPSQRTGQGLQASMTTTPSAATTTAAAPAAGHLMRLGNRDPTGEFVRKGVTIYCATYVDGDRGFICYSSDGILRQVSDGNVLYEVEYQPTTTLSTRTIAPASVTTPMSTTSRRRSTLRDPKRIDQNVSRITCIAMGVDGRTLFASTSDGLVRLYAWPPPTSANDEEAQGGGASIATTAGDGDGVASMRSSTTGCFKEYRLHSSEICFLRLNATGNKVFTCDTEGSILCNEVVYYNKYGNRIVPTVPGIIATSSSASTASPSSIGKSNAFGDWSGGSFTEKGEMAFGSVLAMVYRSSLGEYESTIKALKARIHEVHQESAMQAMFKEQSTAETEARLREELVGWQQRYDDAVKAGNTKLSILEVDFNEKVRAMELNHIRAVEEMRSDYEKRLAVHQGAHALAMEALEDAKLGFEEKEMKMESRHSAQTSELVHNARRREAESREEMASANAKHAHERRELQVLIKEIERDGDEESERMVARMNAEVDQREESISVLKAENYLLRRSMDRQVEECKQLRDKQVADADEMGELRQSVDRLNFTVNNLMKEVKERDEVNNTKEDVIATLRTENRQLMKIKFILNYKFEELKQQVEPREERLRSMEVTLSGQDEALNKQLNEMDYLKNAISDKSMRIKGMEGELARVKAVLADRNAMLSHMLHDIAITIEDRNGQGGLAQDKRIVNMYNDYREMLDSNRSIATAVPSAAARAHVAATEAESSGGGAGDIEAAANGTKATKPPFILLSKSNQKASHATASSSSSRGGQSCVSASKMIEALGAHASHVDASGGDPDRGREAGKQIMLLERRNALLEKRSGMIEKNRDRDAFAMQRENAHLLCEMHELQKTNMMLKRQIANGAKPPADDMGCANASNGAEKEQPKAGSIGGGTVQRQRPKSASSSAGALRSRGSQQQKRPMTGSVFRAMREMSSVDQNKMMSYMNRVEEQDKELSSLRGEVEMLREALAREMAPETLNLVLQKDMRSTMQSLRKESRLQQRSRPKSAVPVSY